MTTLDTLIGDLASGAVRIVDLTQPLSERTPVLQLPAPFANTPPVSRRALSAFDDRGPAWAWSVLELGEHTGTHFDAPIHWITGRDGEDVASVAPARLAGPAVVIDQSAEAAADPDHLLTVADVRGVLRRARAAARGRLAAAAHGLGRPRARPGGVPQRRAHARPGRRVRPLARRGDAAGRARRRDRRDGRGRGRRLRAAVPRARVPARRGEVRRHAAREPGRAAADRRGRDRRPAQARRRDRQPRARARARPGVTRAERRRAAGLAAVDRRPPRGPARRAARAGGPAGPPARRRGGVRARPRARGVHARDARTRIDAEPVGAIDNGRRVARQDRVELPLDQGEVAMVAAGVVGPEADRIWLPSPSCCSVSR